MLKLIYTEDELNKVIEHSGFKYRERVISKVGFRDLMKYRIDKILLVCSLYDYYTIIEDGHIQEAIYNEYLDFNLYYTPNIIHALNGSTALKYLDEENFDLIIITLRLGDLEIQTFIDKVKDKYAYIPLVLLASQSRELSVMIDNGKLCKLDKIFIWSGERSIFITIIKLFEDVKNAPVDCLEYGVNTIILVEDNPVFYSTYLPIIYNEVMKQSQKLIEEARNSTEKLLRQRARPKILLAETFEKAWEYYQDYHETVLGIITDMKFKKDGVTQSAGIDLIERIKSDIPYLPIILQSSSTEIKYIADKQAVTFLDKNSRTLLLDLREFMKNNFGFGDYIFRMPDGSEICRAHNLREFREKLAVIPDESLLYHSKRNHFSHWLIARTEFELAYKIRPVHISQFHNVTELRNYLVDAIQNKLVDDHRGVVSVFNRDEFDFDEGFSILGDGSLGGKARGLAFVDKILKEHLEKNSFQGVNISIPKTIVIGTDIFDQFMENNNLYAIAMDNATDEKVKHDFLHADLPATILGDLREILKKARYPLAVRSSSLLEDAMYQPFAGIYNTIMIPNSSVDFDVRFHNLVQAIKLVYASTYSRNAKNYIEATGNIIEEEKMAVIIQELVGRRHEHYFYPHFSGVARSYNYYPFGKAKPKDGIINLAIGLGKTIVEGGVSLQYCPMYPNVFPQFGTRKDLFNKSQLKFWAVDLNSDIIRKTPSEDMHLAELHIKDAERHGLLDFIASTYSADNDMLYEGISRTGPRVINFAPILKTEVFPLNKIVKMLLEVSEVSMNCPVEIEFAGVLGEKEPTPAEFKFLQVRPMVKLEGNVEINMNEIPPENILLKSESALGNGVYRLTNVIFVKPDDFNVAKTRIIAEEIANINQKLAKESRNYLLIGPGRWGSSDPWLGIPVNFTNISSAQVIVEVPMPHMVVDPSQGSHFFQNMTSFKIAYFTVKQYRDEQYVDWNWLNNQETEHETKYIKLASLKNDLLIKVDGQTGKGVIIKGE